MTLSSVVIPLAAFAAVFQTLVYVSIPGRLRSSVAPLVTGAFGAAVTTAAVVIFGFEKIGLAVTSPVTAFLSGLAAVGVIALSGVVMLNSSALTILLADSRLGLLPRRQAIFQILVRIPVFTALIEEAFFRGLLHAALMALYPTEIAVWLGAGLFGLWHIGPALDRAKVDDRRGRSEALHTVTTVVATTLIGMFLVWLRIETGSIWAPVAVHASTNMTMAFFARTAWIRRFRSAR